ncbi:MAG: trans-aconitate 2-methyltransferase [Rhizobacter sp.]
MTAWDHAQYLKFADERTRPARDLLARVPLDGATDVVDLGCGPGNSTALLVERWPAARVTGVDSSSDMLSRARADLPAVNWVEADIATWRPADPVDLLYGNAVVQWLPDHDTLLPSLVSRLRSGGVLAIQMPHNHDEPSHRLMRETPGPWAERLGRVRSTPRVSAAERYHDWLATRVSRLDIWETRYQHVMADADAIVEWVKGTGLRPYLDALDAAERPAFLEAYRRGIDAAYPPRADGRRLFPFPRLFIVAVL